MTTLADFKPATELVDKFIVHETLQHAFKLQLKATEIQQAYDARMDEVKSELAPLLDEINELTNTATRIVNEHVTAGKMQDGQFSLQPVSKPRRVLDTGKFREQYQEQFRELFEKIGFEKFKPAKKDAEIVLTKHQIENACVDQGEYRYEVFWNGEKA